MSRACLCYFVVGELSSLQPASPKHRDFPVS